VVGVARSGIVQRVWLAGRVPMLDAARWGSVYRGGRETKLRGVVGIPIHGDAGVAGMSVCARDRPSAHDG
jgi:hypothetical protein